jgi:hypothetical protein
MAAVKNLVEAPQSYSKELDCHVAMLLSMNMDDFSDKSLCPWQ